MIDYSILNPKKQIWINLELYFESYEFYNFYEFSGIFLNLFLIYFLFVAFKMNEKLAKMGFISRVYTWMRRGTRGHVPLPRGQCSYACVVLMWHVAYLYLLYILLL